MVGFFFYDAIKTNSYGIMIVFGPIFLVFYLFAIFKMQQGVNRLKNYLLTELE